MQFSTTFSAYSIVNDNVTGLQNQNLNMKGLAVHFTTSCAYLYNYTVISHTHFLRQKQVPVKYYTQ